MLPPPPYSSPYQAIDTTVQNAGAIGVRYAWDTMRQFWGGVINQSWADIDAAMGQEVLL